MGGWERMRENSKTDPASPASRIRPSSLCLVCSCVSTKYIAHGLGFNHTQVSMKECASLIFMPDSEDQSCKKCVVLNVNN